MTATRKEKERKRERERGNELGQEGPGKIRGVDGDE
jgi:hypothetical protein